jgi:hypothetical protein
MTLLSERPTWLSEDWPHYTGWRLPTVPPHPLDDPALLQSASPWDRFLYVLVRAQAGDFRYGDALVDLVLNELPRLGGSEVEALAGAILSVEELRRVFPLIGSEHSFSVSRVAKASYWIEFLEPMFGNRFDSELRPLFFSHFLEARELESGLEDAGPRNQYGERVRLRIRELRDAHPHVEFFLYGKPLHPEALLSELVSASEEDDEGLWEASASIANALFAFETLTGAPIRQTVFPNEAFGCIVSNEPVPSSPLRLLQLDPAGDLKVDRAQLTACVGALRKVDLTRFHPGQRYFFGHALR